MQSGINHKAVLSQAAEKHIMSEDWVIVDDRSSLPTARMASDIMRSRPSEQLSDVTDFIESISKELREISLEIHDHPELRFKERHAHRILTSYLGRQHGWTALPHAYGMETAFVAVFDGHSSSGPVVSFNVEYDALPNIGHACGHNLIAIVSLAAALAVSHVIQSNHISGRVVLFGTPAEEGGGGKIKLLKAGAYSDQKVDISLISHPGKGKDTSLVRTSAFAQFTVEYFGKEAHAADRPWEGINALDALISAIQSVSLMRQQTQAGDLIQYRISNGGSKPNIIHAYAAGVFVLRAPTLKRLEALKTRFHACLEGAAIATNAKLQVKEGIGYKNHIPNHVLGRSYAAHFRALGGELDDLVVEDLTSFTNASTDQGDISHVMPSLSPNFWIRCEDQDGRPTGGPHTPDFTRSARTEEAHKLALRVASALACTALDILTQTDLLDEAKRELSTTDL